MDLDDSGTVEDAATLASLGHAVHFSWPRSVTTEIDARVRILIADDHPVLRDGISAIIGGQNDLVLVGEASNSAEALEQFRRLRPDVTLMDLQMPRLNGVDAIATIGEEFSRAPIIVLTTYAGDALAMRAEGCGQ